MKHVLKTSCRDCAFADSETLGCAFGNEVYGDTNRQFTDGYCRVKRNTKWLDKFCDKDAVYDELDNNITAIVLHKDMSKLTTTLDSLEKTLSITDIVVVGMNLSNQDTLDILECIKGRRFSWSLERFIDGQEIPYDYYLLDWCSRKITTSWFLGLHAGDRLEKIDDLMLYDNFVGMYYSKFDPFRILFLTKAFIELGGNQETTVVQKLQEFENAEDHWRPFLSEKLSVVENPTLMPNLDFYDHG